MLEGPPHYFAQHHLAAFQTTSEHDLAAGTGQCLSWVGWSWPPCFWWPRQFNSMETHCAVLAGIISSISIGVALENRYVESLIRSCASCSGVDHAWQMLVAPDECLSIQFSKTSRDRDPIISIGCSFNWYPYLFFFKSSLNTLCSNVRKLLFSYYSGLMKEYISFATTI